MAKLKHSLRSYFKTPIFSLKKNFICFSGNLYRKKTISLLCIECRIKIFQLVCCKCIEYIQTVQPNFGKNLRGCHSLVIIFEVDDPFWPKSLQAKRLIPDAYEMSQIKAEISLRTNVKLNFHENVGCQWYQWIPDFL